MDWLLFGVMALLMLLVVCSAAWAASLIAKRSRTRFKGYFVYMAARPTTLNQDDLDHFEREMRKTVSDITGQPLTLRERFESECG